MADPYLSLWLTFIGPHLAEIERGSADRVIETIKVGSSSWRGRAIGPIVREGLSRPLPFKGLTGETVGGYWTRTNVPEVDIIGADRSPLANVITFAASIKWLVTEVFSHSDLSALAAVIVQFPGANANTPHFAVSRNGASPNSGTTL